MSGRRTESVPDEAYYDRNQAAQAMGVMALQLGFSVGIKDDPEWPILYIDLPQGQVSWHIPKKELKFDFPPYSKDWDKTGTNTKRVRMQEYIRDSIPQQKKCWCGETAQYNSEYGTYYCGGSIHKAYDR